MDRINGERAELLHAEITSKVLEASFEVINELGAGFLESVYEKAMILALRGKGIKVEAQVPLDVRFRGELVGQFFADLVVEERVIVELKAVKTLLPEHQAQVINYLKATRMEVGLLINFGTPKLEYRRLHG
ncbi:MAG TPA: GxxExxY protein [Holophagaceae bacterium]|nr:GxxExxY protein [Holophagaceae bacterium]